MTIIHMIHHTGHNKTACGILAFNSDGSSNRKCGSSCNKWEYVNCQKCLKRKPKRGGFCAPIKSAIRQSEEKK